jgi:ABC-type nickel/cobalt efflux system permease component RcnA
MGKQEDHNTNQKRGSEASGFDQWAEQFNPFRNEHDIKGWNNGAANQPAKESSDFFGSVIDSTVDLFNPFSGGQTNSEESTTHTAHQSYSSGDYDAHVWNANSPSTASPKSTNWALWIIVGICLIPVAILVIPIALMLGAAVLGIGGAFYAIGQLFD